jgi:protein required for attachment to host cells
MTTHTTGKSTFILVANRTLATIFASHGQHEPLQIAEQIENPRGRLQSSELEEDRPGRSFDRGGHGRHALSSEESARDRVEHNFAGQIAELLEQRRNEGVFDQLVLIAGPKFLGMLREAISEPTRKLIKAELNKELIAPTQEDIRKHLAGLARV